MPKHAIVLTDSGPDHTSVAAVLLTDKNGINLPARLEEFETAFGYRPGMIPDILPDGRYDFTFQERDTAARNEMRAKLVAAGLLPVKCLDWATIDNRDILKAFARWLAERGGEVYFPEEFGYGISAGGQWEKVE